jgi:hypothetical protein
VPQSNRLRVEEPGKAPPSAPHSTETPGRAAAAARRATRGAAAAGRDRQSGSPAGPASVRQPRPPQSNNAAMLGGPRPLPSQRSARVGLARSVPGMPQRPGFRPQQQHHRPSGMKPAQKRDALQRPQQAPAPARRRRSPARSPFSEGMTVKDLADRSRSASRTRLKALLDRRLMMTINSAIDLETAESLAAGFGAEVETRSFEQEITAESDKVADPKTWSRAGRSSRSWATSITARRRCSTRSARRASPNAKPAASRSTSAPTWCSAGEKTGKSIVFLDTPVTRVHR